MFKVKAVTATCHLLHLVLGEEEVQGRSREGAQRAGGVVEEVQRGLGGPGGGERK